jgi:hypothetical protein
MVVIVGVPLYLFILWRRRNTPDAEDAIGREQPASPEPGI